jgi:hypothetical protein
MDKYLRTTIKETGMTKGQSWKRFLEDKGWLVNDVIKGQDDEKLCICLQKGSGGDGTTIVIDTALVMKDYDILCYEKSTGTVFFHWDDIMQISVEFGKKKRHLF